MVEDKTIFYLQEYLNCVQTYRPNKTWTQLLEYCDKKEKLKISIFKRIKNFCMRKWK